MPDVARLRHTTRALPWAAISNRSALWHVLRVRPYGHRIGADFQEFGTHAIVLRLGKGLEGGADRRREGVARGE